MFFMELFVSFHYHRVLQLSLQLLLTPQTEATDFPNCRFHCPENLHHLMIKNENDNHSLLELPKYYLKGFEF